jgi:Molybdopterin oxidoreductase
MFSSFNIKVIFFYLLVVFFSPVGALTSKPYSFLARPWELRSVDSIDIFDSLCSPIRIDVRGSEILRILPRLNDSLNAEWISDKIRFSFDGLTRQRIGSPLIQVFFFYTVTYSFFFYNCLLFRSKNPISIVDFHDMLLDFVSPSIKKHLRYVSASWFFVFSFFKIFFLNSYFSLNYVVSKPFSFRVFVGDTLDLESSYSLKQLFSFIGFPCINYNLKKPINLDPTFRSNFLLTNSRGSLVFQDCDSVVLFGCNLRFDSPLLNSSVRSFTFSQISNCVFSFGQYSPLSYSYLHLGNTSYSLVAFLEGRHFFSSWLLKFQKPFFVFGSSFLNSNAFVSFFVNSFFYNNILSLVKPQFLFLPKNTTVFNLFEAGFEQTTFSFFNSETAHSVNFFLGALYKVPLSLEQVAFKRSLTYNVSCYFGAFGNNNVHSSIVLPTVTFFEKNSLYVNCYGLIQRTRFAVFPPHFARPEWKTLIFLTNIFSNKLLFNPTLFSMRKRLLLLSNIALLNSFNVSMQIVSVFFSANHFRGVSVDIFNYILFDSLRSFYRDSSLSFASRTMSLCSQHFDNFFLSNFFFDLETI